MNETDLTVDALAREIESSLRTLVSPLLEPLFWTPELLGKPSAWWGHVPFAFWIMSVSRPRVFVELGSFYGVSYASFCEAAVRARTGSRCYAVDTWEGDRQAGLLDEAVYRELKEFHDRRYASFSELLKCKFDDALLHFADGSIDLLHIDGLHTYEAVKHDFESWRPKLSDRAVVLFHDTNVLRDDFGVHKLFAELAQSFGNFEFLHGHGLGVLAVGASMSPTVKALCALADSAEVAAIRERFSHLGALWTVTKDLAQERRLKTEEIVPLRRRIEDLELEIKNLVQARERATAEYGLLKDVHERASAEYGLLKDVHERTAAEHRLLKNVHDRAIRRLGEQRKTIGKLNTKLDESVSRASSQSFALADFEAAVHRNFASALDDPSRKLKFRLKKRALKLMGHFAAQKLKEIEQASVIRRSVYFDRLWYLERRPELAHSKKDPALHYLRYGAKEGADPGPLFSGQKYLESNPDVVNAGQNPLFHYEVFGREEGRALARETSIPNALEPAPASGAREGKSDVFSILYVSGESTTPGNFFRVTNYLEAAKVNGVYADWVAAEELASRLEEVQEFDVLVIWRTPWNETLARAVEAMHAAGKTVVFDCDDLMTEPSLAQTSIIDGIRTQNLTESGVQGHYTRIRQTMLAADICFASTEKLAFYMRWAGKPTFVLPNGFDRHIHDLSRRSARDWRTTRDGFIRIGYAGGSRTHQRDFALAVEAIARILREHRDCRLVLFHTPDGALPLIDIEEYPPLAGLEQQIEWRPLQPLMSLSTEMARLDINLAPLEVGNPFCEGKSELKFFDAALVNVPTVASPTGPFRRAIDHGRTGFLATSGDDWYVYIKRLAQDPLLREQLGHNAYIAALAAFGPRQRALKFGRVVDHLRGGPRAARGFALEANLSWRRWKAPMVFPSDVIFEGGKSAEAAVSVTVTVPLYNYEKLVVEALDSVAAQTLAGLDLIIVDGHSTDDSLGVATKWARENAVRFNRIVVLKNQANYGLGFCRNSGFDAADTPYVLPLDADNRLRPDCCTKLLAAIEASGAAYVYPTIQHFGASDAQISNHPYDPQRFVAGNYVDAMALVSKEAWAMVGGCAHVRYGFEDYDFWSRMAEIGLAGEWLDIVLAEYRVHPQSMMKTQTTIPGNYRDLILNYSARHPWTSLIDRRALQAPLFLGATLTEPSAKTRLDKILPILRCPVRKLKLAYNPEKTSLVSVDGIEKWPIVAGRPALSRDLPSPEVKNPEHVSNELPDEALTIIRETQGLVLNLSAGGSREKFDHVIEVEYAIFRHTDIVADAHALPFDDECFDAIVVMNAFEHYREPHKVAAELHRILKPGGRIHIRTAFLQPLHEKPWHFFNCTRYGLAEWFKSFETERLHVSKNFCPNHTMAWIASELEAAFRKEVSPTVADAFRSASIGELVDLWRDPSKRDAPLWTDFERLPQTDQEVTAAGFELIGRRPQDLPNLKA
jgi:ubiquinone/menaquinone biosynthesis C-methylase UbiE/glycosyltransferase involved in cell wall biosynthesis